MRGSKRFRVCGTFFGAVLCLISAAALHAVEPAALDATRLKSARDAAVKFLRTTQADDGGWTAEPSPGMAGLVTAALLQTGVPKDDPMMKKALANLSSYVQPDGGIYYVKSGHRNYETSISLLAFHAANKDGRYDKLIASARDYLKKLQWDEGEDVKPDDVRFGGAGYGSSGQRPDLSNTAFLLDALKAAGVGADDPSMKNALVFVSRCQNLESQYNTTPFASKVNDGGFYYTVAAGGSSPAGKEGDALRSYGSMTYAGLKSMIYAGLGPDDPRVKAAVEWLRKNYTLTENPGMGQSGLFYYYHTFAKALDAMGATKFADAKGTEHDWPSELGVHLLSLQKENGSWLNSDQRWREGDPNLTTAYVLLTLKYCEPKGK